VHNCGACGADCERRALTTVNLLNGVALAVALQILLELQCGLVALTAIVRERFHYDAVQLVVAARIRGLRRWRFADRHGAHDLHVGPVFPQLSTRGRGPQHATHGVDSVLEREKHAADAQAQGIPQEPSSETGWSRVPVATYVLGGVSALGLGAFVGFRVAGSNSFDALARDCKPTCTSSRVDRARQKYVISDIALGVGAAAAVAAIAIYFSSSRENTSQAAAVLLAPTDHGLVVHVTGRF
jgi:hypothetical protein